MSQFLQNAYLYFLCVIILTIFAFFNLSIDLVSTFLISNFLSYYPIIIKLFRTKNKLQYHLSLYLSLYTIRIKVSFKQKASLIWLLQHLGVFSLPNLISSMTSCYLREALTLTAFWKHSQTQQIKYSTNINLN